MHLRQSLNGGRLSESVVGQGSFPAILNRCSQTTCDRSKTKRKRPSPPKVSIWILSYPLLDFFHPLSPVCRFSPIRLALPTRPPRVAVASVPNLLCGRPIGDTNL